MNNSQNFKELLEQVRCFVFDVDGVLTDGSLLIEQDGTMLRRMNIKDGYALQLAAKKGYSSSLSVAVHLKESLNV